MAKKKVLLIGLAPNVVDLSSIPSMTSEQLAKDLQRQEKSLGDLGFDAHWCLTDLGETAEAVVQAELVAKQYDVILIGAGVRAIPANFALFEKLINVVHAHAPKSKLCFNTNPNDTQESVLRWIAAPTSADVA